MSDDNRLERIENKIDKITDHVASIDVTIAKQHISLDEHIRRTSQIEQELLPIKAHVNKVKGALGLITLLAAVAAIAEMIRMMLSK